MGMTILKLETPPPLPVAVFNLKLESDAASYTNYRDVKIELGKDSYDASFQLTPDVRLLSPLPRECKI